MIFATVAVGDRYIDSVNQHEKFFRNNNFDVHVLTDKKNKFSKFFTTYQYDKLVWSYFDKLIFAITLVKNTGSDVFFCDGDEIDNISSNFITNFKGGKFILTKGEWETTTPIWSDIKFKGKYWKPFRKFLKKQNINPYFCPAYREQHIYFPADMDTYSLLYSLEMVKPVLEYSSIIEQSGYSGTGSGEGAGLGYAIIKNNLKIDFFDPSYFTS